MAQERRQTTRAATELLANVKRLSTGKVSQMLTKNVSDVGLCLLTDEPIARGVQLGIKLQLPTDATPVICTSEVVWIMTPGTSRPAAKPTVELGVKFVDIQPRDRKRLQQYAVMCTNPPH